MVDKIAGVNRIDMYGLSSTEKEILQLSTIKKAIAEDTVLSPITIKSLTDYINIMIDNRAVYNFIGGSPCKRYGQ